MRDVTFTARDADRYTQTWASTAPDLERLRREVYHWPAADPTPTVP
ncbi:hypothetical protein OH799_06925 [Nocardia sp. NBC_00881]|nr:hypothetical protein OH799_06925 [Nocardia sp. NBC_00881]